MTHPASHLPPVAAEVLHYWLADGLEGDWPSTPLDKRWFGGGVEQDVEIDAQFGSLVAAALDGDLVDWEHSPLTRLALVIVLDQFTRNVYRGKAQAFKGDVRAQKLVLQALALEQDQELPRAGRVFLYMPLMHAENRALQDECVSRFEALVNGSPPALSETLQGNLRFAREHREIIQRFGRFPYRNGVLGRKSTPEEIEFLKSGPRFGQ
ncbi:DUF924 family protein [Hydrogenophaga sp. PAMC20947]|uniref:DUF924 family protein n=1 Tax=Hydrogenophaga sp. PAMC20947 TaxID=2565558 RepID=UPI00109E33EE|nr:DUF924 family protein [Hydrogenophaga sp. PAMC20947]QCB46269.1 DUF924 domain-containing protein [Hydrogenophaga sp. PAMC20947]